jgi:signal transduction histidine kinase
MHDLNNLLQPILGYADLLADELPAGDPRRAWADEIRQAAAQARALVDELHRALRSGSAPSA